MPTLPNVRADVAAALEQRLPGDTLIVGRPAALDAITTRTLLVGLSAIDPPDVACPAWQVGVLLWAVSPLTDDDGHADDDVDAFLEDVLTACDAAGLAWTRAERAIWRDTNPAYRIELGVTL